MKRSNLYFLLVLSVVSCSKTREPSLVSALIEKASTDENVVKRTLANIPANQCLKDIFTVDLVKSEIKEIEKKFKSGTRVSGKWKHLDLSKLPIPQANFLKTYGNKIGDLNNLDAFDYSSCSEVPCIFNTIYGKKENVAGYVHYLWYLKMGNLLAASNTIYNYDPVTYADRAQVGTYSGQPFEVSAYLYKDKEIFAFWRLLKLMKEPHTRLSDLKSIQRLPNEEGFETIIGQKGEFSLVCGKAYSSGTVVLQSRCLSLYPDLESGNFYESVLHELTHQVDYHQGKKLGKGKRSEENDYLEVSSIYLKEYKDENGKTIRQWEHKPGIKLVTSYAGTSPAENFAETIAYFRVDGTHTQKSITSDHWDFVSKNYFFSKSFEKSSLMKEWLSAKGTVLSQQAFIAVGECSQSTKNTASTFFKKTDFDIPVLPIMMNCLGTKADEISLNLQSDIKVSDPDGCRTFTSSDSKSLWEPQFKLQLLAVMNRYLKELQNDKEYFANIQGFIKSISDVKMATEAYLACDKDETEEACYNESVIRLSLEKLAPLNLPDTHAQELAEMYLAAHSLNDTKDFLRSFYRSFVVSHRSVIEEEALALWNKCSSLVNDDASPTGKNFTLSSGYLVSSIYNCINLEFPETRLAIVNRLTVDNQRVQNLKEERILKEEVNPELRKQLLDLFEIESQKEENEAIVYTETDKSQLRNKMLSDFGWVKDVLNSDNITRDCKKIAINEIVFATKYHLKQKLFSDLVDSACQSIYTTSEYNSWLEASKSVFAEKSVDGLEGRILELASVKAKECLVTYPMDSNLNRIKFKKDREACLVDAWPSMEEVGLNEFRTDPLVVKFHVDVEGVKSQLSTNRRRLQIKIIKEFF
jgi:hypothetical protein